MAPWMLIALIGVATPAKAETSRSFAISAQIANGCSVSTDAGGQWGQIDLGTVDGAVVPAVEAGLLSSGGKGLVLECTPGVSASLSADNGDHATGGIRRLARVEGGSIAYQLFVNGTSTAWTTQSVPVAFSGAVKNVAVPVRARTLPAGPLAAGLYSDTVRVTLSW